MDESNVECRFTVSISGEPVDIKAAVPARPVGVDSLLPVLRDLSETIVAAAMRGIEREGKSVSCRAGCGACCRQIVPISEPEARAIAALVEAMPPERRDRVKRRFADALARLDAAGLLERTRDVKGKVPLPDRRAFGLDYFHAGVPCPFLEDESCSIHAARPIACREYLVTSPAEYCADPAPGRIAMVPLAVKLSEVLYRFADGAGRDTHRYQPLVTALEWSAEHPEDRAAQLPGPKLLENFLRELVK